MYHFVYPFAVEGLIALKIYIVEQDSFWLELNKGARGKHSDPTKSCQETNVNGDGKVPEIFKEFLYG